MALGQENKHFVGSGSTLELNDWGAKAHHVDRLLSSNGNKFHCSISNCVSCQGSHFTPLVLLVIRILEIVVCFEFIKKSFLLLLIIFGTMMLTDEIVDKIKEFYIRVKNSKNALHIPEPTLNAFTPHQPNFHCFLRANHQTVSHVIPVARILEAVIHSDTFLLLLREEKRQFSQWKFRELGKLSRLRTNINCGLLQPRQH